MIKRSKLADNFTTLNNKVLEAQNLSLKAKGLWAFVMTKPNGWQTSIRGLESQLSEGKQSIATALKELETAGLYRKVKRQNSQGRFEYEDTMYDEPCPEKPYTEKPHPEKSPRVNTDIVTTEQANTDLDTSTDVDGPLPDNLSYGNPQVNLMFQYWQKATGIDISGRTKQNRNACSNLLKKHGPEKLRHLIDGVALAQGDRFAPRIADFVSLQGKLNELLVWGRQQQAPKRRGVVIA